MIEEFEVGGDVLRFDSGGCDAQHEEGQGEDDLELRLVGVCLYILWRRLSCVLGMI